MADFEKLKDETTQAWTRAFIAQRKFEQAEQNLFADNHKKLFEDFQAAWADYERLSNELEPLATKYFRETLDAFDEQLAQGQAS